MSLTVSAPAARRPGGYAVVVGALGGRVVRQSADRVTARCPAHDDRSPSLSVTAGDDGRALVHCHAGCKTSAVLAALGLEARDLYAADRAGDFPVRSAPLASTGATRHARLGEPQASYPYRDEAGQLLYTVHRFVGADGRKVFQAQRADGHWTIGGVPRVVYGLPELVAAVRAGHRHAFIVEGEKDCDTLRAAGAVATTAPFGAGKWRPEYSRHLVDAGLTGVTILPDHDGPGASHARQVADRCAAAGLEVRLLELPGLTPETPAGFDVTDWFRQGGTLPLLETARDTSATWSPGPSTAAVEAEMAAEPPVPADDQHAREVEAELQRLRVRHAARQRFEAEARGAWTLPPAVTLRARLLEAPPVVTYRIDALQPAHSRVLLAAQFKAGKTTLVGNLLRSLVDGVPLFDRFDVWPVDGAVVVIDTEMGSAQGADWLRAQRIQQDDRIVPLFLRGRVSLLALTDPAIRAAWAAYLRGLQCRYLVLDCLRPVLDALGLNEHTDAGLFLTAFDALLAEADVPEALVVHHMGHAGERARGDSRLRDWPDAEWRLVRQNDDPAGGRFFSAYGRDVDQAEAALAFAPEGRRLTLVGGSRQDAAGRQAADTVRHVLGAGPLSLRQIEAACAEHPRAAVRVAVQLLVADRQVETSPGKRGARMHRLVAASAPVRRECAGAVQ